MEIIALIKEARDAGLTALVEGDELIVRGPRRLGSLARELIGQKAAVLAALSAECHGSIAGQQFQPTEAATADGLGEPLATDEQLRLWLSILNDQGVQFRLVNGQATAAWPASLDTTGRRRDWERHREQIARILLARGDDASSCRGSAVNAIASGPTFMLPDSVLRNLASPCNGR
jgi:hypothetical protein